jgi:hypothetical protein
MRTFSSFLEVTLVTQIGKSRPWIPAWLYHTDWLMKPSGPSLLDEPLKDFIVNPVDLPWKWVKRLITSGKRVNHDSQWKCTTSAECKTVITAVLTVTSDLGPLRNRWSLMTINVFLLFIIHLYIDHMFIVGLMQTWCYSYDKTVIIKS